MEKYFNPEAIAALINEIDEAETAVKYLFDLPQDHQDVFLRTPELLMVFIDLKTKCNEFINSYNYHLRNENAPEAL